MNRFLLGFVALVLATPAAAQVKAPVYQDRNGSYQGAQAVICLNVDGTACAAGTAASPTTTQAQGPTASGSPPTTAPVLTAGWDGTNIRTIQTGTGGATLIGTSGSNNVATLLPTNTDGISVSSSSSRLAVGSQGFIYNGATQDRVRSIGGGDGTGIGVAAVAPAPQSTAAGSITPVVGSVVASINGKGSAGNLYQVTVTTGAFPGYLYVFNSTTQPADGAVVAGTASGQYQICYPVAVATAAGQSFDIPERFSVGIRPVFSSTACGTLTADGSPVFMKVRAQ